MLKIKDNVDLKELEKFGFVKVSDKDVNYIKRNKSYNIYINHSGEILTWNHKYIGDLIQAGLVEELEETE